jgi:hypothetical protein
MGTRATLAAASVLLTIAALAGCGGDEESRSLSRVGSFDPVDLGQKPVDVAAADGSAWVLNADRTVTRVDESKGKARVTATVKLRAENRFDEFIAIAGGKEGVWAVSLGGDVVGIDTRSNRVRKPVRTLGPTRDVAVGAGYVWTLSVAPEGVRGIDPKTGEIVGEVEPVPENLVTLTAGPDSAWVAGLNPGKRRVLIRLKPREKQISHKTIRLPVVPELLAAGAGGVWGVGDGHLLGVRGSDAKVDVDARLPRDANPVGLVALGSAGGTLEYVWTLDERSELPGGVTGADDFAVVRGFLAEDGRPGVAPYVVGLVPGERKPAMAGGLDGDGQPTLWITNPDARTLTGISASPFASAPDP